MAEGKTHSFNPDKSQQTLSYRPRKTWERALEMVHASLAWGTFAGLIILSYQKPAYAAAFIIAFYIYWILKAINGNLHLLSSYNHRGHDEKIDWHGVLKLTNNKEQYLAYWNEQLKQSKRRWRGINKKYKQVFLEKKRVENFEKLYHVVLFPFVDEDAEVLKTSINSVLFSQYDKSKVILLMAAEERAGIAAQETLNLLKNHYSTHFRAFLTSTHPDGLPGEIRGKSANASYAVEHSLLPWLAQNGISVDDVIISNLDSDTVIHPQYLARVTFEWLMSAQPHRCSYQPITLYNNNIWDSPALVRVVSLATTFWLFTESSRTNRLITFSSHSMSLRALIDVGFWKKDVVNEDGFIFFQCYFHYKGNYTVKPVFVPVSMDTCLTDSYRQTLINQYKQKRRWAYNVEFFPWVVKHALFEKTIPLRKRLHKLWLLLDGNYQWAVASIIILTMGFMPALLGQQFTDTAFGFNLPRTAQILMTITFGFLVIAFYINMVLLPKRPPRYRWTRTASMYLQWILIPIIAIFWVSLPAIDAQTRLALGKYMEFWVTPKKRIRSEKVELAETMHQPAP